MKLGPKFKIARRLGAPIFEKTQTQKYALSLARKERSEKKGRGKQKSEYGKSLIEKQKARFSYGLGERQFANYVAKALKTTNPVQKLFSLLESRLDNVAYRAGLFKSRAQSRQAANHGHLMVNGKRVTIPSILLSKGDKISVRAGSSTSPLFGDAPERMKAITLPVWLSADPDKQEITVEGEAVYAPGEQVFDLGVVVEFYSR